MLSTTPQHQATSAVTVPNSVRGQRPWYTMPLDEQLRIVDNAPRALQPHLERFARDGVVVIEQSLTEDMCDFAHESFRELTVRNRSMFDPYRDESGYLSRIINLHAALPAFLDLFMQNQALPVVAFLFGAKPSLYTSLYFERGSQQDIHRDTPFFCTIPNHYFVGFWIALENADEQNGALRVIRGGHLRKEVDVEAIARSKYTDLASISPSDPDLWSEYQKLVLQDCLDAGLRIETLPVSKGSTVIWHPQLPHGGSPIFDKKRSRNSLVVHTTPTGTPVFHENVFFNPSKRVSDEATWQYIVAPTADIVKQTHIDIMHERQVPINELL
jgi:phytanoyl-CoA hydroxylase